MQIQNTKNQKLKILISGAGVAGLALAQGINLYLQDYIEYEIIEKDKQFEQRKQGYSLTIQQNGQKVFQFLNIIEELQKNPNSLLGRGHNLFSSDGQQKNKSNKKNSNQFQYVFLPRQELRKILVQNINVNWDTTVLNLEQINDNKLNITFNNGKQQIFDYVICAEGIFSPLRSQIIKDLPVYLNVLMINGIVKNNSVECKHSYSILDDGTNRLFFKPYKPGYFMWQLTHKCSLETAEKYQKSEPQVWLQKCIQEIGEWKHGIINLVKNTELQMLRCGPLYFRNPIDINQIQNFNNFENRIILVGDSVHPMPPFKGQGANQALEDVQQFIEQFQNLIQNQQNTININGYEQFFSNYQQQIIERAKKVQIQSVNKVEESHRFLYFQNQEQLKQN